jgi:hypothetical protein
MEITWSNFRRLNRENIQTFAPPNPGVYILWKKIAKYEWACFYIGQAQNLVHQLLDHTSSVETNRYLKETITTSICGFQYATIMKQPDRDAIEQFLFEKYQPECNFQDPGGIPAMVNLPRAPRH